MPPRTWFACLLFVLVALSAPGQDSRTRTILILGDSLTAGYGLEDPVNESFPALIQKKIAALETNWTDRDPERRIRWKVVNAGVSGDTTSGGLRRVDWVLRQPVDVFVLALGSNDGLRGIDPALISQNLTAIAAKVAGRNPGVRMLLLGQRMPPNLGDYRVEFDALFPSLAPVKGGLLCHFYWSMSEATQRSTRPMASTRTPRVIESWPKPSGPVCRLC